MSNAIKNLKSVEQMYLEVSQVGETLRDGGEVVTIENDSGEGQTT